MPTAHAQTSSSRRRILWGTLAAIAVVLLICYVRAHLTPQHSPGTAGSVPVQGPESTATAPPTRTPRPAATTPPIIRTPTPTPTHSVKDDVQPADGAQVGAWQVEVQRTLCGVDSVGAAPGLGMKMKSHHGFCLVRAQVVNDGPGSARLDPSTQRIVGISGKQYPVNADATRFANPETTPFELDARPGDLQTITFVYDVPRSDQPTDLLFSAGAPGSPTATLPLDDVSY